MLQRTHEVGETTRKLGARNAVLTAYPNYDKMGLLRAILFPMHR